MNTTELVSVVAKQNKLSKAAAKQVVSAVFDSIQTQVQKGKTVYISRFGTFTRAKRKARNGRNPQTGDKVRIPATKYPKFRPSKAFKLVVRNK